MKLSLPPKLVKKLVWVLVIWFCKISFLVTHLMSYYAKTGRSRLIIAWLLQRTFYILWIDNNNDLPTLDKFCKFATSCTEMGHKYSSYWLPTGLSGRSLPSVVWLFEFSKNHWFQLFQISKEPYALVLWKKQNQRAINSGWLFVFFQKNCEPWLCKNWIFDVLRTMIMIGIIIKGLFLFLITTHSTPVPTRCWLKFFLTQVTREV